MTDDKRAYMILPERPPVYDAKVFDFNTACGSVFVTVSLDEAGCPREVFLTKGTSGGCTQSFAEALGKMISIGLRCNVDPKVIVKMLTGIYCTGGSWQNGKRITSCAGAVALALTQLPAVPMLKQRVEQELTEDEVKERVRQLKIERDKIGKR